MISSNISATPLSVVEEVWIFVVLTWFFLRFDINSFPNMSSPIFPIRSTLAPKRDNPTAWLAPFPPGVILKDVPLKVSPARGNWFEVPTKSMFILPMTVIGSVCCSFIGLKRSHEFKYDVWKTR